MMPACRTALIGPIFLLLISMPEFCYNACQSLEPLPRHQLHHVSKHSTESLMMFAT